MYYVMQSGVISSKHLSFTVALNRGAKLRELIPEQAYCIRSLTGFWERGCNPAPQYYKDCWDIPKTELARKLLALRQKAIAGGMMLKSENEILEGGNA